LPIVNPTNAIARNPVAAILSIVHAVTATVRYVVTTILAIVHTVSATIRNTVSSIARARPVAITWSVGKLTGAGAIADAWTLTGSRSRGKLAGRGWTVLQEIGRRAAARRRTCIGSPRSVGTAAAGQIEEVL
jgi:hypothetical protein